LHKTLRETLHEQEKTLGFQQFPNYPSIFLSPKSNDAFIEKGLMRHCATPAIEAPELQLATGKEFACPPVILCVAL
jgi:hypothetical protein